MRWPWSRKPEKPPPVSDDTDEAVRARRRAEKDLERAKEQATEVQRVTEQMRRHRHGNHFAKLFGEAFGGDR
jgi:hypothetical protein